MKTVLSLALSLGAASCLLVSACAQDVTAPNVFNLDRPTAVAFGCWGDVRVTNGEAATADQPVVRSAQPAHVCAAFNSLPLVADRTDEDYPPGQAPIEGAVSPHALSFVSFVLQPTKGSVVVVEQAADGLAEGGVIDADPFTPGRNAIPIGTLPVDIATSSDGCYALAPNAGSCDLSSLEIDSALDRSVTAKVERIQLTNGAGEPLLARPAAIVAEPPVSDVGFTCPAAPQGIVYIAYPDCNWVAAIEPATGKAVGGIRFGDGTVEITDGNVSCARQCGDGAVTSRVDISGPGRPVALHMDPEGRRLYIGAENLAAVTWVELDTARMPVNVQQVALEGDVGVTALSASALVNMGGSTGLLGGGSAGEAVFVYAVASDATVRVVDVKSRLVECDTQVDPRYLHDVTDVGFLSCMPVGDVGTPPRRSGVRSPGIHIPRISSAGVADYDGVPLDVAFATVDGSGVECAGATSVCPNRMVGEFALITAASGTAWLVNVDDDVYGDFERVDSPADIFTTLAIAHQLRDLGSNRDAIDFREVTTAEAEEGKLPGPSCANIPATVDNAGPRIATSVARFFDTSRMVIDKTFQQPTVRATICEGLDGSFLASDLSFNATLARRELAFPDLSRVRNETVRITWEGLVSLDSTGVNVDGPPTRAGYVSPNGAGFELADQSRAFCRAGVEPYDILALQGCDPSRGDAECGLGETCYLHPDIPSTLFALGTCVPVDRVDALAETCREFMISRRRYTMVTTKIGEIEAVPRRRALDQTPVDGCESVSQCEDLYRVSIDLGAADHPAHLRSASCNEAESLLECPNGYICEGTRCVLETAYSWACEEDPTRRPGKNWCLMTCDQASDCQDGYSCGDDGYCVAGPIPPAECVQGLQRYRMRVGEAYAVIGERSGFLHNRIYDPGSDACIENPTPDPLLLSRVPLTAPACTGDSVADLSPNPCSVTLSHTDLVPDVEFDGSSCVGEDGASRFHTRDVPAIRIQRPGLRFHVANISTTGDADCTGDEAGGFAPFPAVHQGSQIRFEITGGYLPIGRSPEPPSALVYPLIITPSPDGTLWVLDQGDRSSATQGQLWRYHTDNPSRFFAPTFVSLGQ